MPKPLPDHLDILVGRNLRRCRVAAGLTRSALGEALRESFYQLRKYERGANCISASPLYTVAAVLRIPLDTLFESLLPAQQGEDLTPLQRRCISRLIMLDGKILTHLYALLDALTETAGAESRAVKHRVPSLQFANIGFSYYTKS